jgi:DNA polymerase III alpha subunit
MVDDFIERRHGRRQVRYDFELKEIRQHSGNMCLSGTADGCLQKLAGYLGEADLVRRDGQEEAEELDKHKEKFLRQAVERSPPGGSRMWLSFGDRDYVQPAPRSHTDTWPIKPHI